MITVNIRRQGNSAVITIPSDALKIMGGDFGDALVLDVKKGQFTAKRVNPTRERRRYKLSELLHGVTQEKMDALLTQNAGALDGGPVGKEVA